MKTSAQELKTFLQDVGLITFAQWKELEKEAGSDEEAIGKLLISKKILTPEGLLQIKGHLSGVPFINLEKTIIDPEILRLIPQETARAYYVIAYHMTKNNLDVAMLNPDNLQALDFLKKKTGLEITPTLTNEASIENGLKQYEGSLEEEFSKIVSQASKNSDSSAPIVFKGELDIAEMEQESSENLQKIAGKLSVVKITDSLLRHAVLQNASDIHIEPTENAVVVRFRIDGILHDVMILPKALYSGLIARIKVLSNLKLDEHRLPQDGRLKIESDTYKFSIRVSIIPVADGEKIVMRMLKEESKGLTLESLGFGGRALDIVQRNITRPHGMILITGPTGSGKTTTLYAIMDILNTADINISTIEDPIEYRMPRINQTQVKPQIGLTFANGLRSLLRQDPDVIMVGEIRDDETASLAINAALTGHLVLSTLHTNSAAGAMPRLLDMKVEPFLIASTTNVIIAQRLVRKLCPDGKEAYNLSPEEVKTLGKDYDLENLLLVLKEKGLVAQKDDWTKIKFYRPKPSDSCPDGYKGRLAINEVLEVSVEIKKLIAKEGTSDEIQDQAKKEGMITMIEDGFIKVAQGITTIEEIMRVTKE